MHDFLENNKIILGSIVDDVEKYLVESDTGDMSSWPANKNGLKASAEFQDPDSSLYKYVAYFDNSSKEVDHFLVTYDQHTNSHHSTNKTLVWNDSRQTRKAAYNILICSDIVKNQMNLKPKTGSDAECAADSRPEIVSPPVQPQVTSTERSSSAVTQNTPEQENNCIIISKLRGRTVTLDFSQCPITPDTLVGIQGVSFPNGGIQKIKFKKKNSNNSGPFTRDELLNIEIESSKFNRSETRNFNNYFIFLQKLTRHVANSGWEVDGDLNSIPRFSSGINNGVYGESSLLENINEVLELTLTELISEALTRKSRAQIGTKKGRMSFGTKKGRATLGNSHARTRGRSRVRGGGRTLDSNCEKTFNVTGGGSSEIARKAKTEYDAYKDSKEGDDPLKSRIQNMYWPAGNKPSTTSTTEVPWSAAFISFCADGSGLNNSSAHQTYMKAAKNNRDSANGDANALNRIARNKYVAFLPSEKEPSVGDIVCKPRDSGDGFDNIGPTNHCDIYVGNNDCIGGNLSDTVGKNRYSANTYTMVISKGATVTAIERNNAVASNDNDTDSDDNSDV